MENWSNHACLGYLILAMEAAGFTPEQIQVTVNEAHYLFDIRSVEEAAERYQNSPY